MGSQEAGVVEKMFLTQAKELLAQILKECFNTTPYKPSVYFDANQDKLIVLAALGESPYLDFLNSRCK